MSSQHPMPNAQRPVLYRIIPFNIKHGNCGGSLVQFQAGDVEENALPFDIGKVLVMSDIRPDDVRGNHAHHGTEEILVALTGGCVVDLDDGRGRRESVRLSSCGSSEVTECGSKGVGNTNNESLITNNPDIKEGLLLYPHVWRVMRDFEPGTILLVVANMKYDEADYIRDRAEFEGWAEGWCDLGGSADGGANEDAG